VYYPCLREQRCRDPPSWVLIFRNHSAECSESRTSGPDLRLGISWASPCGEPPEFAVDRLRCGFGSVDAFPLSDLASDGVGCRSDLGPLFLP